MNKNEAEKLSLLLIKISADLEQSVAFVKDKDTEENYLKYREAIGKVMGYLYFGVKDPLWERFQELKPKSMEGPYEIDSVIYDPQFYNRNERHT